MLIWMTLWFLSLAGLAVSFRLALPAPALAPAPLRRSHRLIRH